MCHTNPCICNRPETVEFSGGGKRDKEVIPCYHLYPRVALLRTLARYQHGRVKYGDRNWEGGLPAADCYDRTLEHLFKYVNGWNDEDHLAAAVFNINCIMVYEDEGQVPINFRRVNILKEKDAETSIFDAVTAYMTETRNKILS